MENLIKRLIDVATGATGHLNNGMCPDFITGNNSRDEDCPACQVLIEADRIAQQAAGTHPAPCARHCEANAFQIEIRRLQSHVSALEVGRDNLQGQVEILTTAIQAASSAMASAPIVSRYHRAAIEALRDYAGQDQQHEVGKDIDHADELRRMARKIGHPAGDVPAVMHAAARRIEELERFVAAFQRAEAGA